MLRLSLPEELLNDLRRAAEKTLSHTGTVRIFSHHDADGIGAASILALSLYRENIPFHITILNEMKDEVYELIERDGSKLVLFSDIGSGSADELEKLDAEVIVLDHHRPLEGDFDILEINAHRYGVDGTKDASGSTMAFLFALALNSRNLDLAHLSLAGSTGDRQHIGGFSGINRQISELASSEGLLSVSRGLNLPDLPLAEAISQSYSPFFRGISGRIDAAEKLVDSMGLNREMTVSELSEEDEKKLASMLMIKLLKQGCLPDVADELIGWRYTHVKSALRVSDISSFLDAAVREDAGIAIAAGMGDEQAILRAKEIRARHQQDIMNALLSLEKSGARQMKNIQWFWTYSPEVASAQTGIGMQYLLDQEKPAFGLTEREDETLKISARGTGYLISKGLNLTEVCRAASEVGGRGGGHNIASGCTIPAKRRKDFLKLADGMVGAQMH